MSSIIIIIIIIIIIASLFSIELSWSQTSQKLEWATWLTPDAKIQPVFTGGKAVAFGFSHHGHSLVTLFSCHFHALIAQNLTSEFTQNIYALSGNLFSDSWSWEFCVILFLYRMKDSCYQDSFVIHGWFVYWVFGWEVRRFSKSSEIRFLMASFSKMSLYLTLLDA